MNFAFLFLLMIYTWRIVLPTAQISKPYSANLSEHLSGCALDANARTSPAAIKGIPSGLSVSGSGTISGTPDEQKAAAYEFGVTCKEAAFIARVKLVAKE